VKEQIFQAVITLTALINPVVCAAIFSRCTQGLPPEQKRIEALVGVLSIGSILIISAVAGTHILKAFGISLDAFTCAGGAILIYIGVGMLRSANTPGNPESESKPPQSGKVSLTPLILFGASPGTITGVITVGATHHSESSLPLPAIIGVLISTLILAVALSIASRIPTKQKAPSFIRRMISCYMGVIVIAMGVQFMLTGIRDFMQ
tara:strand:+ start:2610 stop:3227 length:618 start_codon:yes stop_codon:yes gene_type:complete